MSRQGTGTFGTEAVCTVIKMFNAFGEASKKYVRLYSEDITVDVTLPVDFNIDVGDRCSIVLMKMKDGSVD